MRTLINGAGGRIGRDYLIDLDEKLKNKFF